MDLTPCGLLHSDICGSIRACRSPQLFAAYRVLLRLLMPRHPSCALISLTYLFRIMVSSLGHIFRCFPTEEFLRNCIYPFNLSLKLDIYFCFKIVSSLLFRYSIFKEPESVDLTFEVKSTSMNMVGWRGLEPPTSRLSAECSNQLSYQPIPIILYFTYTEVLGWWRLRESNPWPPACKAGALPAELNPRVFSFSKSLRVSP